MLDDYLKQWLQKAISDIHVMRHEYERQGKDMVADAVCFHAQQAVEKLLKAYLVSKNAEFGKTHNLHFLLNKCIAFDNDFQNLSVGKLTDYAVEVRYPDDFFSPSDADINESITVAENALLFILRKLDLTLDDVH